MHCALLVTCYIRRLLISDRIIRESYGIGYASDIGGCFTCRDADTSVFVYVIDSMQEASSHEAARSA